ncbi:Negative regulator of mitotic exit [Borealophlyctis nickersoniae]|nr:Negative regulator of mitotic exit [Borealophlyctis nickersoniae]
MTVADSYRPSKKESALSPIRFISASCGYHNSRNMIFCFGEVAGQTDSLSDLWAIETLGNTERQITNAGFTGDTVRDMCMAPISDTQFVVHGGNVQLNATHLRYRTKTLVYDAKANQWSEISKRITTSAPLGRQWPGCTTGRDGRLYMFGGMRGDYYYNDVWALDFGTMAWINLWVNGTAGDNAPAPRDTPAVAMVSKWLVVFGGTNADGNGTTALDNRFYFFDTTARQWVTASAVLSDPAFQNPQVGPPPTSPLKVDSPIVTGLPPSVDDDSAKQGSTNQGSSNGAPVGAIVGGVIGGLVVVVLAVVGGLMLHRRRSMQGAAAATRHDSLTVPPPPRPMSIQSVQGLYADPGVSQPPAGGYTSQPTYGQQQGYPPVTTGYQTQQPFTIAPQGYSAPPMSQGYSAPPMSQGYSARPMSQGPY